MSKDDKKKDLLDKLIAVPEGFYKWLQDFLGEELVAREIMRDLGVDVDDAKQYALKLDTDAMDSIARYRRNQKPDKLATAEVLNDILKLRESLNRYFEAIERAEADKHGAIALGTETLRMFLHVLAINYFRLEHPLFYWYGQLLGFLEESHMGVYLLFKNVFAPLYPAKPVLGTEDNAKALSNTTLLPLTLALFIFLDKYLAKAGLDPEVKILYGWDILFEALEEGEDPATTDIISDRTLSFSVENKHFSENAGIDVESTVGISMVWVPEVHGGPGIIIAFGGGAEMRKELPDNWLLTFRCDTPVAFDILIGRNNDLHGPADASVELEISRQSSDQEDAWFLPNAEGTRLEFGKISLRGELSGRKSGFAFEAQDSALVIDRGDGDGFLGKILPAKETRIDFAFGFGYSQQRGWYIAEGTGIEATIPINRQLGPLDLQLLTLALGPSGDSGAELDVTSAFGVKLGPVTASVDRIGFRVKLDFPDAGGNLGLAEIDFGFKPPSGVGLAIDAAGTLTGGGYLFFEPEKQRYAGVVHLDFAGKFNLKAIGLLTTRLPNNKKGYSLLLIISAEDFTPVDIGLGFTLNAVGGLVGVNRTANLDILRDGLKAGSLNSVMFPKDPVRNAPKIINALRAAFPPAEKHYLFGPMAKIGWGKPTLLTLELGIILEFIDPKFPPIPSRLILLAKLRAILPSLDNALIKLQMDAIGEINFDKGEAALDAVLFDSRLLAFSMTGGMALRTRWKQDPTFLLSVGGFNPRFPAPAGFPSLARVSVHITKGDNPRVRLDAYLALTSNTFQLGAKADVHFEVFSFTVDGYIGFDAIFIFRPFSFIADFSGGVQIKWKSYTLAAIHLEATIAGPRPWHVKGKATFSVWIFDKTVNVDKAFGSEVEPELPPPVDAMPLLLESLQDRSSWVPALPAAKSRLVSLRKIPESDIVYIHPAGSFAVKQQILPLNVTLEKFGNTRPKGDNRYHISKVTLNGRAMASLTSEKEHFAPAQFLELTEDEKFARPSFEKMDAGVRIDQDAITFGTSMSTEITYETEIIDDIDAESHSDENSTVTTETVDALSKHNAASRMALRQSGEEKFRSQARALRFQDAEFVIASKDDLSIRMDTPESASGAVTSETAAHEALKRLASEDAGTHGRWQVVRKHVTL